jgi:hypothetical protein
MGNSAEAIPEYRAIHFTWQNQSRAWLKGAASERRKTDAGDVGRNPVGELSNGQIFFCS